jgi:hypothetical protein
MKADVYPLQMLLVTSRVGSTATKTSSNTWWRRTESSSLPKSGDGLVVRDDEDLPSEGDGAVVEVPPYPAPSGGRAVPRA